MHRPGPAKTDPGKEKGDKQPVTRASHSDCQEPGKPQHRRPSQTMNQPRASTGAERKVTDRTPHGKDTGNKAGTTVQDGCTLGREEQCTVQTDPEPPGGKLAAQKPLPVANRDTRAPAVASWHRKKDRVGPGPLRAQTNKGEKENLGHQLILTPGPQHRRNSKHQQPWPWHAYRAYLATGVSHRGSQASPDFRHPLYGSQQPSWLGDGRPADCLSNHHQGPTQRPQLGPTSAIPQQGRQARR
ncbi:hypothetical protein NDU88_005872 [Pleurodeles waltl]|uniref:Uncharacterized protein n=1 Tax=Pleurodeles waltl TaxID=8319 RepID=A0AAV7RKY1_PLEWA|nr:hypothetical protein NDU88_005872 [Pleurodeles waltl]